MLFQFNKSIKVSNQPLSKHSIVKSITITDCVQTDLGFLIKFATAFHLPDITFHGPDINTTYM